MNETGQGEHGVTPPEYYDCQEIRPSMMAAILAENAVCAEKAERYEWMREHIDALAEVLRGMQTRNPDEFDAAIAARMAKPST